MTVVKDCLVVQLNVNMDQGCVYNEVSKISFGFSLPNFKVIDWKRMISLRNCFSSL